MWFENVNKFAYRKSSISYLTYKINICYLK
jgi:hypothetical protein